jgi:hypothetical protein
MVIDSGEGIEQQQKNLEKADSHPLILISNLIICIPPSLPINPHPNCPRVISLAIILMMLEISDDKIW